MQNYLQETYITITLDEKKLLFKCRTNDIDIKETFAGNMKVTLVYHASWIF